jgi:hypothetical protein
LLIADLHSDSLLWKRNFFAKFDIGQMDLPRLREGNVDAAGRVHVFADRVIGCKLLALRGP